MVRYEVRTNSTTKWKGEMRKLTSSECTVLLGLMAIGSHASAQEYEELPVTNMATVQVNAIYQLPAGWESFNDISLDLPSPGSGLPAYPSTTLQNHIADCVDKYSQYKINPNYPIRYLAYYGWWSTPTPSTPGPTSFFQATYTSSPPGPVGWSATQGDTKIPQGGSGGQINIYALGYATPRDMFETVAHESAHAAGVVSEQTAEAAALAAYNAWQADSGSKCGGL